MNKAHTILVCCLVLVMTVFSAGCSTTMPSQEETSKELVPIKTIGILPAQPASLTILPPGNMRAVFGKIGEAGPPPKIVQMVENARRLIELSPE